MQAERGAQARAGETATRTTTYTPNYTGQRRAWVYVDADRDVIGQEFALPGLSDSANLAVFYENDKVSARLAYNWRDEFLSGFDRFGSPVFTEEYAPLDANVTWFATEQLALFFEAINITEEVQRIYVRYPEQFIRGNQYGARFNIGARYNFE